MSKQQDAFVIVPVKVDGEQQQASTSAQVNSAIQSAMLERGQTQNHHQEETQGPLKQIIAQQDSLYKYISWKDPVKTFSFYVSVMSILLGAHYLPLTRFALKIGAIGLGVVSVAEYSGRMFSPNTFLARLRPKEYKQVSEPTLNATLKDVHDLVQFLAVKIQKVVWGQELGNTFATFLACTGLYWLAQVLSPFWLVVLGINSLFVAPLVTSPRGRAVTQDAVAGAGNLVNAAAEKGTALAQNSQAKAQQLSSQAVGAAKNVAQRGQEVAESGRETVLDVAHQAQDSAANVAQRGGDLTQNGKEIAFDLSNQANRAASNASTSVTDNVARPLGRNTNPFKTDLGVPGIPITSSTRTDLYSDNSNGDGDNYTHRGRGDAHEKVGQVGSEIMDRGPPLSHQTFDTPRQMAPPAPSARKPVYQSEPILEYEGNSAATYQ